MPDPLAKSFYQRFREANTGWLRRLAPLVFGSLLVLTLGAISAALLLRYNDGVINYRTPIAKFPTPTEPGEPIVSQVVLIVMDGLRDDMTSAMPTWQHLRPQSASATVLVPFAGVHSTWTTLVTGAEPEINDASLSSPNAGRQLVIESLFVSARRANLNVALAASAAWEPLIAPQQLNEYFFPTEQDDAVSDHRIADKAANFLSFFAPNFALVHLRLPDAVAQQSGAEGAAYLQAVLHSDQLLAQLVDAVDLRKAVLMLTSSFGEVDRGGHGGADDAVTRVPLLVAGAHVKAGVYGIVRQSDLAPTIAALIGSGIPSASQGSILFSLFDLSDAQRATKAIVLARQQREFGQAYLNAIGGQLSEPALADPLVAQSSLDVKNYESAYTIASLAAQQVQHDTRTARLARIERERFARAPLAMALMVVPLLLLWLRRSMPLLAALLAAIAFALVQHGLYLQAGLQYSFSELSSPWQFGVAALARSSLAVVAGSVVIVVYYWRDEKPSRVRVASAVLVAGALSIYLLSIPFAFGYITNGLSLQWYIPDQTWAFVEVFSLVAITATSLGVVPLAALVALVYWFALIVAHRAIHARALIRTVSSTLLQLLLMH